MTHIAIKQFLLCYTHQLAPDLLYFLSEAVLRDDDLQIQNTFVGRKASTVLKMVLFQENDTTHRTSFVPKATFCNGICTEFVESCDNSAKDHQHRYLGLEDLLWEDHFSERSLAGSSLTAICS